MRSHFLNVVRDYVCLNVTSYVWVRRDRSAYRHMQFQVGYVIMFKEALFSLTLQNH